MEWKALLTAFGLVFLAELGDKTQLTTMMLAAQHRSAVAVFVGASAALVLTSLLGVAVGEAVTRLVPASAVRTAAAVGFLAIGGFMLVGRG
ncbi:MAG: TMEM165/GDT1 family protein [Firmicutes bacterium]|nr:TMEM165/GDT1 family protein [Bacillota bacterium]